MPGPKLEGIYIHHIDRSLLASPRVRAFILNALKVEGRYAKGLLDQTVATWQDAPTFPVELHYKGGFIELRVQPKGTEHQLWKWVWLDQGTRVRYATMTRNFKAKTSPGSFSSGTGAGGVAYVSKKVPRPGIAARNWSAMLNYRMEKRFKKNLEAAIRQAIFGHG